MYPFELLFFKKISIYFERKRENVHTRASVGEGQRERERIPSRLHAVSSEPHTGLNPRNRGIMAALKSRVRCLTD